MDTSYPGDQNFLLSKNSGDKGYFALLCAALLLFILFLVPVKAGLILDKSSIAGPYHVGDTVRYLINITNNGQDNFTKILLNDSFDMDLNFNNISSCAVDTYTNPNGSTGFLYINVSKCTAGLGPGQSYPVFLNFTAVMSAPSVLNIVNVSASNFSNYTYFNQSQETISISELDDWNSGLDESRSSIVSPYVLRNAQNTLNFTIYRQAGEDSCLENIIIILPTNFTYSGWNWTSAINYTTSTNGSSIVWRNNGSGGFFCGEGPKNFAINVTSTDDYSSSVFVAVASADDNTTSNLTKKVFTTSTFPYFGSVLDSSGNPLGGAVASLQVVSIDTDGETVLGTFTGTTNSSGGFLMASVPMLNHSINTSSLDALLYRVNAAKYNDSEEHYAMNIGPSLPEIPEFAIRSPLGLNNISVYLKPAVTFHIRTLGKDYRSGPNNTNVTCPGPTCENPNWTPEFNQTYVAFDYNLKDKKLGYPLSNSFGQDSAEEWFSAPLDRNYSLMLFPDASFPVYVNFMNISSKCNLSGYNLNATGVNASCTIRNGTYLIDTEITADMNITNLSGSVNMTNLGSLWVVPYMLGAGEMLFDQDSLPFNIGQLERWPKTNATFDDSYNKTAGTYNIYLPATQAHSDILLVAYASEGGTFYRGAHKISIEGKILPETKYNFTLSELLEGSEYIISSNNVSADWNSTNVVNTTAVRFNLVDGNSTILITENSFIEMKLGEGALNYTKMLNAQNGNFSLIIAEGQGIKKMTIYSQAYTPISVPVSSSILSGGANDFVNCSNGECNITLSVFELVDPVTREVFSGLVIDFIVSNSSCDVPAPASNCYLIRNLSENQFSSLKAILMGDTSLRISKGNLSVHYTKTDLLASGPPDASFSQNFTGDDMNAAWIFGSKGPEIYDNVLLKIPYSSSLNDSDINATIPLLYDAEFNVIWNSSVNDTSDLIGTDYEDYLNTSYEAYLNGTGVNCTLTNVNLTQGLCYKDNSSQVIWMKIPHFSGVGPEIKAFAEDETYFVVNLTSPDNNITTNQSQQTHNFTVSGTNSTYSCTLYYNGTAYGANSSVLNNTITSITANASVSSGVYTWNVTCTAGLVSNTSSRIITIDTVSPLVSIILPVSGQYLNTKNIAVNLTVNETNLNQTIISLQYANGTVANSTANSTNGNYAVSLSVPSDGVYNINATSYDLLGHLASALKYNITVDTTNPAVAINSPSSNASLNTRRITLNITATDANLNYTNLTATSSNGSASETSSNTGTYLINLTVFADGSYNITATAYDRAGRSNSTYISNITSDTTAPTMSCSLNATSVQIGENLSVSCNASDIIDSNVTPICGQANTSLAGVGRVNCTATDDAGNTGTASLAYLVRGENITIIEGNNTNITVTPNRTEIILYEDSNDSTITIPDTVTNATLDLSYVLEEENDSVEVTLNNSINVSANTSEGTVEVQIPSNVTINASINWTGVIHLPKIASNATVTVTPDSGKNATVYMVVEVGSGEAMLNFTRAVRLLIPGESGKYAGYYHNNAFTKITITCVNDSQGAGDLLAAGGDCKIDSSGNLVIWTKHFTSFVTYNQSDLPSEPKKPSGGGGGTGTTSLFWTETKLVADADFVKGYTTRLSYRQRVKISIGGQDHYVGIVNLTSTKAVINISSDPQQVTLYIGDDAKVNLDGDDYYDIYIKLNSITNNTANVTVRSIFEKTTTPVTEGPIQPQTPGGTGLPENHPPSVGTTRDECTAEGVRRCSDNGIEQCLNGKWVLMELCSGGCDSSRVECVGSRAISNVPSSDVMVKVVIMIILLLLVAGAIMYTKKRNLKHSALSGQGHKDTLHSKANYLEDRIILLERKGHKVGGKRLTLHDIRQDISSGLHYVADMRLDALSKELDIIEFG